MKQLLKTNLMDRDNHTVKKVIFFDGVCNLCNGFIDFVIKRDSQKIIYYCSLQSEKAKQMLEDKHVIVKKDDYGTIYFLDNTILYSRSSAILRIVKHLGISYNVMASFFLIIPRPIRDYAYAFIAKNRYRFFGKKETCRLPTPKERNQFL